MKPLFFIIILLSVNLFFSPLSVEATSPSSTQQNKTHELRSINEIKKNYKDDFFGTQLSEKELDIFNKDTNKFINNSTKLIEAIDATQTLLILQKLQDGNCAEALNIEGSAQNGEAESQWLLADLYNKGLCVKQDKREAFSWIKKASEQNYKKALFDRAQYHFHGIGTQPNQSQAFLWLIKSAEQEDSRAYPELALAYLRGEGTAVNYNESLKWALKGAELGDQKSQLTATTILIQDRFFDPKEAYKWLLLSKVNTDKTNIDLLELINELENEVLKSVPTKLQNEVIKEAEARANIWQKEALKIKTKTQSGLKNTLVVLPQLKDNFSQELSQEKALESLFAHGLEKDRSLFHQAINEDNLEVFKLFLKAGASIETIGPNKGAYLDIRTPLYRAAEAGSEKIANYLIASSANLNAPANHDGDTAILAALARGHYQIAEMLLSANADLSHPSIMTRAVEANNPELLQKLYNAGLTDINHEQLYSQNSSSTPLENAVSGFKYSSSGKQYCFEKSVKFLLSKGAKISNKASGYMNETTLENAIRAENPEKCVRMLLKNGANPSIHSQKHYTILFRAVISGHASIVKLLIEHGEDPNETFTFDQKSLPWLMESKLSRSILANKGTPLMLAISENKLSVAKTLIENGANPYIKTTNGKSALSIAKESDQTAIINLITEYEKSNRWKSHYQKVLSSM